MRSITALGRRQVALTRRWHHSQSSTIGQHHHHHRQRYCRLHSIGNAWQQQQQQQKHHHQHYTPRCSITTTSSILSTPDSFHGISLPDDDKLQPSPQQQQKQKQQQQQQRTTQPQIKEAEVVTSDEEKIMTREFIKEMTRAEMLAHSTVVVDIGEKSDNRRSAHSVVADLGKKANSDDGVWEDDLLENEESKKYVGAYGRLSLKLEEALRRHQEIVNHHQQKMRTTTTTLAYAHSCMVLGELHYKLGNMDQSQEFYMDSLKDLMGRMSSDSDHGDDGDNGRNTKSTRREMMIAQSMHALATIHARCGEFDEASRWYDEALKNKLQFSEDIAAVDDDDVVDEDDPSDLISYRYELGKTYNGMAALEIMKGGDVQWDKAMSLFEEAESNFLHGYELDDGERTVEEDGSGNEYVLNATNASSSTRDISKAAIEQMSPLHVEFLIGIRSNMGELLRRRGQLKDALQKYQLALDMARLALEIENEKAVTSKSGMISDGPSRAEQGNTIVDLLVNIADNHASAEDFDAAAEAYEQALSSHVFFRRWSDDNENDNITDNARSTSSSNALPATIASSTKIKFDINAATTIEAAIRNNLANALGQIGQDKLALEHYEASLAVKRRVGGDFHMEIAHTLMGMGALLGGPLKDFTKGLNCFKEALFIYRTNLDELIGDSIGGNQDGFFGDEDAEEIDKHIQNALRNISLIEAALLKNRDGASNRRRR